MARHKYTTVVCLLVVAAMLVVTVLFFFGEALGMTVSHTDPPYVSALFSTDRVHTLDIVVDEDDWAGILANAQAKEYIPAHVVIDGETVKNVGLRTKGNSSLSSIATSNSDRYSFKIEFDHYSNGQSYMGLDKLALNNITQDTTYLKDYVSYQMMNAFGADAPLSSFVWITVNGEDWGLYLAVEGIEEAFAARNYGADYGQIYKPDNMDMNAGRGEDANGGGLFQQPGGENNAEGGAFPQMPEGGGLPGGEGGFPAWDGEMPEGFEGGFPSFEPGGDMPELPAQGEAGGDVPAGEAQGEMPGGMQGGFAGFGGRGNSDVSLIYTDDEHDSYPNIFDNAVFDPSNADKDRLIASLKQMNAGEDLEEVVNIDEVLRYFVVHNFVLNFDSYTGSMVHNYYLYEEDGVLSMIAWDYNLAFGAFSMGGGMQGTGSSTTDATTTAVNYPIDTPVSGGSMEDRPLLNQLLSNETYLDMYHALFGDFISGYFDSGAFEAMYDNAVALITPYVEKDPTAFCTYDEFLQAQEALREFCLLRAESIQGQLDGTIASTSTEQADTQQAGFVDASHIDMETMGSNMMGFGRARDGAGLRTSTQAPPDGQTAEEGQAETDGFSPPGGFGDGEQATDGAPPAEEEGQAPATRTEGGNRMQGNNMGMSNLAQTPQTQTNSNASYWLLGGSLLLIIGGLIFAARYKRR